jgi:carbonic anhydrase
MRIAFLLFITSGLLSSACALKSRRTEDIPPVSAQKAAERTATIENANHVEAAPAKAEAHDAAATPTVEEPKIEVKSVATTSAHPDAQKGVEPEKALGWLKNGNIRFRKGFLRKDGQSPKDVQRLATGQSPHTIVLSCSDSRVPPEIVFDQKLGEIFTVRNAGEIPDRATIASIEYAVEHLGSRLILVMGHTSCGAVKAALGTMNGEDAGSPSLNALVHDIHPRLASLKGQKPAADVHEESAANARGIARDLIARSEIIRSRVANGDLMIRSALYHLDSGAVDFDDAAQK